MGAEVMIETGASPSLLAALRGAATLRAHGHQAFFAGGCVRDLLLGAKPKDFDIATSATPDEVIALFPRTQEVGAHFGVVLVLDEVEGSTLATEIATFRHDGAYADGRRPDSVRYSLSPAEDVERRDFTINGMLLDPSYIQAGSPIQAEEVPPSAVLDLVGGQDDLERKIVRTIGDPALRFAEDKLRMLRGIRFAARLGFTIHPATLAAMRAHAAAIVQVSNERVRDELTRMLTEGHARRAFELLDESGLLTIVLPEVARMKGVEQPPQYHPEGDVWVHTLMLLDHLPAGAPPTLAWGMLLHDAGKPATFQPPDPNRPGDRIRFNGHAEVGVRIAEDLLDRLRFPNDSKAQIASLVRHHMRFGDILDMRESTLKRFLRLPAFDEHLALHRADCLSSHGRLHLYDFARQHFENAEPEHINPPLLVTGRSLIQAGYKPGPAFKRMLEAAEDAQLEGRITTPEQGMALIEELFPQPV